MFARHAWKILQPLGSENINSIQSKSLPPPPPQKKENLQMWSIDKIQ